MLKAFFQQRLIYHTALTYELQFNFASDRENLLVCVSFSKPSVDRLKDKYFGYTAVARTSQKSKLKSIIRSP